MGLFDKLVSLFTGRSAKQPDAVPEPEPPPAPIRVLPSDSAPISAPPARKSPAPDPASAPALVAAPVPVDAPVAAATKALDFVVTFSGPSTMPIEVPEHQVSERLDAYAFVLATDPPKLRTADEWWSEQTHKRRVREGSDKAFSWLLPFLPIEVARLPELQRGQMQGPHGASGLVKLLRGLIRERRKSAQQHEELLRALYGAAVAADLAKSVAFEGSQPHYMVRFVGLSELQAVKLDYSVIGYKSIETLSKTDVKWLVEAFGEPAEHQPIEQVLGQVRRNAIARYCWMELRGRNEANASLGGPEQSMQDWLRELVARNIGYQLEGYQRATARLEYLAEQQVALDEALQATQDIFCVADLETTGLDVETAEVLEIAAVQVSARGDVMREFSALVRVGFVPPEISRLTGITQQLMEQEGLPLAAVMTAFAAFVAGRPVFFHNAPFDQGFLARAAEKTAVVLPSRVHDTLPLARQAWPSLGSHKLTMLAEHVGAPVPTHRALADTKAALAVLLAARTSLSREGAAK